MQVLLYKLNIATSQVGQFPKIKLVKMCKQCSFGGVC